VGRLSFILSFKWKRCVFSALLLSVAPMASWGSEESMELQVRRTGPPLKIVREARGPEYIVLRGEMRERAREEATRPKMAKASLLVEKRATLARAPTRVGASRRPMRAPSSLPKKLAAQPRVKNLASSD
jgi:hypothetical protein